MARIRTIKPEFWTDEKLASLPRDVRLLFIASWNHSDDYGVLKGSPALLKAQAFPYDDDITLSVFKSWVDTLIEKEIFVPFDYKGEKYIFITNFLIHQKIDRPSKPVINLDTLSVILGECSSNARRVLVSVIVSSKGIGNGKDREMDGDGKPFALPTVDDVLNFFIQKKIETNWPEEKNKFQAKKFIDHYNSNGWMVGQNKMTSWSSAASAWINRDFDLSNKNHQNGTGKNQPINQRRGDNAPEVYVKP